MTTEKFCLKWNDFKENISSTFRSLREDTDFTDVTLACEDEHQVGAHKAILAASSPFFQSLLKRNKHSHPLIYMRGMKSKDLVAILDFLYYGEANIFQENLESFLALAEEFKLKGLTGNNQEPEQKEYQRQVQQERLDVKIEDSKNVLLPKMHAIDPEDKIIVTAPNTVSVVDQKVSVDLKEMDETIKSMMILGDKITTGSQSKFGKRISICNVCGKEGQYTNIRDHIEANHIEGVCHPCNYCAKTFRSRVSLRMHNKIIHKN